MQVLHPDGSSLRTNGVRFRRFAVLSLNAFFGSFDLWLVETTAGARDNSLVMADDATDPTRDLTNVKLLSGRRADVGSVVALCSV